MSQAALNTRNSDEETPSSRRNNGTRLAGILFLLTVLCTVFVSGWVVLGWMEDAQRLPLSKLVLTGERHYTRNDDIRQAILALGAPGTFMTQDVNIIQSQIERLPWIKQASVRKQWPDELKIHLVEYVPIARWNDQHMVDAEGNTFSVPSDRIGKQVLPMLYGPEGSASEVLQGYREMGQVLAKDKFTLKEAAMTARRSWQLTLNNGIKLNLGRGDTMKRLARFVELYPVLQQQAQTDGKRISYVDLRYDSGAAVGWAPLPLRNLISNRIRHRQNNNDQGDGQKTGSRTGDWHREGCRFSREVLPDGMVNIIGVGSCPSRGMDKGGVNDLESVVKCVQRAIDQAELMADCQSPRYIWRFPANILAVRMKLVWCPFPKRK